MSVHDEKETRPLRAPSAGTSRNEWRDFISRSETEVEKVIKSLRILFMDKQEPSKVSSHIESNSAEQLTDKLLLEILTFILYLPFRLKLIFGKLKINFISPKEKVGLSQR